MTRTRKLKKKVRNPCCVPVEGVNAVMSRPVVFREMKSQGFHKARINPMSSARTLKSQFRSAPCSAPPVGSSSPQLARASPRSAGPTRPSPSMSPGPGEGFPAAVDCAANL